MRADRSARRARGAPFVLLVVASLIGPVLVTTASATPSVSSVAGASETTTSASTAVPTLHNISSLSGARARALVAEALAGLGFAADDPRGPQADDRVVVTDSLVAWIDETGFYGKLQGLWWLSPTVSGDRSFSLRAADGRPVNQLVVGEDGAGAWPIGNRGAEHVEVPNDTPEPHHDPACVKQWCAAYAHDEAGSYTAPLIPWWRVCDPGTPSFLDHMIPVEVSITPTKVRLVYEGRLVKTADSASPWTNTSGCKQDWLFPDGIRRPVYLRVGYELTNDPWVDRIQQIVNPAGNPPFASSFSVIGGFEITAWPQARPDKLVTAYVRPEDHDVGDQWYQRTLVAGQWNPGFTEVLGPKDVVIAWMAQPVDFSTQPAAANARTLRLSNVGPKDNLDVAFCLCLFHGTIELGGGLLHNAATSPDPAGAALPVAGGQSSIEARRRLETPPATAIADVPAWSTPTTSSSTSSTTTSTAVTASPASAGSPVLPAFTG
ncbi:MAG: hypothetical protein U0Q07_05025 [Acidimicrobiales bacterium]